ncbi:thioesterase [Streptomyces cinnamoneus]|uniref:Thioesterase n=1 Tax=Streptomyces cinnamoneus TaxID=53446 RepID=A0A2G1XPQ4_STRCJ|nr:alpha/beta fold hydrolase [Streptomyces cinnamoneus]PHQ53227.1 thioesterase [Streptomyces cinnamoneus]PPT12319.1 thioesterase [Streptomyces cinnamoneus]
MPSPAEENGLWIRRFTPSPDPRARLVCLPHAGGAASYFFHMSEHLAPSVEVLSVQYPGRQDRHAERCIEDVRELAERVCHALACWGDLPLLLFGQDMGALVGFEVARLLEEKQGVPPLALFAAGCRAPAAGRDEHVHLLDDRGLVAEVQRVNGGDADAAPPPDERLLRRTLPSIRSDYKAFETYRPLPGARVTCPVIALVGDRDPKVSASEANAWRGHTCGAFELQVFPGGHFFLEEHQPQVVNLISDLFLSI